MTEMDEGRYYASREADRQDQRQIALTNSSEMQAIRQQLDAMSARIVNQFDTMNTRTADQFDRTRIEMREALKNYTLAEVHKADVTRLEERDTKQQQAIDETRTKVDGLLAKWLYILTAILAILSAISAFLKYVLHIP